MTDDDAVDVSDDVAVDVNDDVAVDVTDEVAVDVTDDEADDVAVVLADVDTDDEKAVDAEDERDDEADDVTDDEADDVTDVEALVDTVVVNDSDVASYGPSVKFVRVLPSMSVVNGDASSTPNGSVPSVPIAGDPIVSLNPSRFGVVPSARNPVGLFPSDPSMPPWKSWSETMFPFAIPLYVDSKISSQPMLSVFPVNG